MLDDSVDKKGVIKAMFFALSIAFLGIGILGWQYRRIEKNQIPALEEKIEQRSTETVLDKFMRSRIGDNGPQAMLYLTEGAVEQERRGEFVLINQFEGYEILNSQKVDENEYRYTIKLYEEGGVTNLVEIISLIKIMDQYYVDSVQIAG